MAPSASLEQMKLGVIHPRKQRSCEWRTASGRCDNTVAPTARPCANADVASDVGSDVRDWDAGISAVCLCMGRWIMRGIGVGLSGQACLISIQSRGTESQSTFI